MQKHLKKKNLAFMMFYIGVILSIFSKNKLNGKLILSVLQQNECFPLFHFQIYKFNLYLP